MSILHQNLKLLTKACNYGFPPFLVDWRIRPAMLWIIPTRQSTDRLRDKSPYRHGISPIRRLFIVALPRQRLLRSNAGVQLWRLPYQHPCSLLMANLGPGPRAAGNRTSPFPSAKHHHHSPYAAILTGVQLPPLPEVRNGPGATAAKTPLPATCPFGFAGPCCL